MLRMKKVENNELVYILPELEPEQALATKRIKTAA